MTPSSLLRRRGLFVLPVLALACSDTPTEAEPNALLSVTPVADATDVATNPVIELRFARPVAANATDLIALQIGDCPGPVVGGSWTRAEGGTVLRFQVMMGRLEPGTRYTVHLGGGIRGEEGELLDLVTNGDALGGTWVTEEQVQGMLAMGGMGMGPPVSHSGPGWQHPNGFYGLAFPFTTTGTSAPSS